MLYIYIRRLKWLVILILLQVLILNNIHIAGYATPFLYVYLILKLNTSISRNGLMLWGFSLGLLVDVFSNTPGMNAIATVLLAFTRPFFFNLFISKDTSESISPGFDSIGIWPFTKYALICILIHHSTLLLIESFSFFDLSTLLLKIVASTLLTFLCVLAIEGIRK